MGPRRLALLITELDWGGAERCLVNLAVGLDPHRFVPEVYSLGPRPAPGQDRLVADLESAGIRVHFGEIRHLWQLPGGLWRLSRDLKRQQPHLLQSFLYHANLAGGMLTLARLAPLQVLGIRVADPALGRLVCEGWVARRAAHVVCVSDAVARYVQGAWQLPAAHCTVIPNGIDPTTSVAEPVSWPELGIAAGRRVILAVGRLHRQKGLDWLLRASPLLFAALPEIDLAIVGHGPEEAALRQQARDLGVAERVHFLGWRPDVPRLLRGAELLVLPSRWEGMPNVVLEAMAAGRPVVATPVEGVAELLGPETAAQTVPFGEDRQLADCLASILRDRARSTTLGEANRARVLQHFSRKCMVEQYQRLYERLLEPC